MILRRVESSIAFQLHIKMAKRGIKERAATVGIAVLIASFCALEIFLGPIFKERGKK